MGDRYYLIVTCNCGFVEEDVYYAPTCGFTEWKCPACGGVTNLEEYTGISYADCSNVDLITSLISKVY